MTTFRRLFAVSILSISAAASQSAFATLPACQSAFSDSDGDGYGWENNASCLVGGTAPSSGGSNAGSGNNFSSGLPVCASASSDPDGDGYGWENNASCLVSSSSPSTDNSGSNSNNAGGSNNNTGGGTPTCVSASSDSDGDGYGWENNATCLVAANSSPDNGSDSNPVIDNNPGNDNNSGNGNQTVNRTTRLTPARSASATADTTPANSNFFETLQAGDYILIQNAWNSGSAAPGHSWSQTVSTNNNGTPVSWIYDWGPGIPGANGRASDDFNVRAYPELVFGIKDEFRTSAPKSQIGLPVRVDQMPNMTVDYAFSSEEFGESRTVDISVTDRFPNGSTIQGERNVAVESFLYESNNGVCDDGLNVNRTNGSNHQFEVMLWLDSGAERLPAGPQNFVTTVSLGGASYDVYTKSNDSRYIAFVAKNPQTSGSFQWNDFVDWARANAHRVEQQFGAISNADPIQNDWCVANIIVGTEIFWGAGSFDLSEWTITQTR